MADKTRMTLTAEEVGLLEVATRLRAEASAENMEVNGEIDPEEAADYENWTAINRRLNRALERMEAAA